MKTNPASSASASAGDRSFPWLWLGLSAALFGTVIWLLLPRMVIVMDDDFWYLKSAVETFQRGRPWTSEWLTPWAATTSVSAAVLTWLTGSFSFGVHFTLAAAGVLACWGMGMYVQATGGKLSRSIWLPWLVLGTPTVTFMLLMFTSVAIYLACLWWCLYLAARKKWGWFFAVWCIGFASRQSAIVWLSIPAWQWLILWKDSPSGVWKKGSAGWRLLAVLVGGAAMLVVMKLGMNQTHGQKEVLKMVGSQLNAQTLGPPLIMGAMALMTGIGIGSLLKPGNRPRFGWIRLVIAVALGVGGVYMAWWARLQMVAIHACYGDDVGKIEFATWAVMAALGLTFWGRRPLVGLILTGIGSVALVSLYAGIFDYYFIDAFCFGLASAFGGPKEEVKGEVKEVSRSEANPIWLGFAVPVLLVIFMLVQQVWNGRGYVRMKYAQDRYTAVLTLAERNVRSGKLDVSETAFAGFGYSGWKLEDHLREHGGIHKDSIGGFVELSRDSMWNGKDGVGIAASYPRWFRKHRQWLPSHNAKGLVDNKEAEELDRMDAKILWFWEASFALKRLPATPPDVPLKDYQAEVFPLNDEEWLKLLQRR